MNQAGFRSFSGASLRLVALAGLVCVMVGACAVPPAGDDPTGENNNDNAVAVGAKTFRIEHYGTSNVDMPTHNGESTLEAEGTFTLAPGETTTVEIDYRVTYDYTPKESDGATIFWEPSSFVLTGKVEWEAYWDTIVGPNCIQLVGTITEEQTETYTTTVVADDLTLPGADGTLNTFAAIFGGGMTMPPGTDTICEGAYIWVEDMHEDEELFSSDVDFTVELTEIGS